MRILSTRTHAAFDYVLVLLLVASPWLLGFARGGLETRAPVALGLVLLASSLLTDYELGVRRRIQMPLHLWIDAIVGVLLALSPWLFEFDRVVWTPHLALGILLVGAAVLTHTIPGYERRRSAPAEPG